jgi:hypothetical protein
MGGKRRDSSSELVFLQLKILYARPGLLYIYGSGRKEASK